MGLWGLKSQAALKGISETSGKVEHLCQRSKCSLAAVAVFMPEYLPDSKTPVNHHLPVLGRKDSDTCAETDLNSESRCNAATRQTERTKNT